jgi:hypothetical protein
MRNLMLNGVPTRACDNGGCVNAWPCEAHPGGTPMPETRPQREKRLQVEAALRELARPIGGERLLL